MKLGDVPGLFDMLPSGQIVPLDPDIVEVNSLGEEIGTDLGTVTEGLGEAYDPFAFRVGDLEGPGFNNGTDPGNPMPNSPAPSASMPTSTGSPFAAPVTAGPGSTTHGSYKGKGQYDLTERDGKTLDNMTAAALDAATKEFAPGFHIMQGSHSHDVAASGGTHDGGGVVDLSVPNGDWAGAVKALRKIGFAAWVRNVDGYGSAGSGAHIHAVLIGNEKLSPQAAVQVQSYLNNDDGLSGSRPDDGPRDFVNNRFVWGETQKSADRETHLDLMRHSVVKQANKLVGTPFAWGGEDLQGLDGAGVIKNAYEHLGVTVPKSTLDLISNSERIGVDDLKPGDLIAWNGDENGVGIFLGGGRFIEPGGPGRVVQMNELGENAINAFGVSMSSILRRSTRVDVNPLNRPAPFKAAPPEIQTTQIRPGTSVVEPHASIKPKQPAADGPLQETTFDQKPKAP